jgi:hypothetical protein
MYDRDRDQDGGQNRDMILIGVVFLVALAAWLLVFTGIQ